MMIQPLRGGVGSGGGGELAGLSSGDRRRCGPAARAPRQAGQGGPGQGEVQQPPAPACLAGRCRRRRAASPGRCAQALHAAPLRAPGRSWSSSSASPWPQPHPSPGCAVVCRHRGPAPPSPSSRHRARRPRPVTGGAPSRRSPRRASVDKSRVPRRPAPRTGVPGSRQHKVTPARSAAARAAAHQGRVPHQRQRRRPAPPPSPGIDRRRLAGSGRPRRSPDVGRGRQPGPTHARCSPPAPSPAACRPGANRRARASPPPAPR